MEKLLDEIASRLSVQIVEREEYEKGLDGTLTLMQAFSYRDVTDEVRKLFKKELYNHMFTKLLQEMEVGEYVEYGFDYGDERPLGTLMEDANDNMAEVLLKLPALNEGERYVLPGDTYICFTLMGREAKQVSITAKMCLWITATYENQ